MTEMDAGASLICCSKPDAVTTTESSWWVAILRALGVDGARCGEGQRQGNLAQRKDGMERARLEPLERMCVDMGVTRRTVPEGTARKALGLVHIENANGIYSH